MTRNELKKRLKQIKATPLATKAEPTNALRRDVNYVAAVAEEENRFDNFFDYEEELVELESAREQMAKLSQLNPGNTFIEESIVVPEESPFFFEIDLSPPPISDGFFQFDEIEENITEPEIILEEINAENSSELITFEPELSGFKYCEYMKTNDIQCKRQAPKTSKYCAAHRKMLKKAESKS